MKRRPIPLRIGSCPMYFFMWLGTQNPLLYKLEQLTSGSDTESDRYTYWLRRNARTLFSSLILNSQNFCHWTFRSCLISGEALPPACSTVSVKNPLNYCQNLVKKKLLPKCSLFRPPLTISLATLGNARSANHGNITFSFLYSIPWAFFFLPFFHSIKHKK
jgi:hypothetical protein